jgi:hypothetical protein
MTPISINLVNARRFALANPGVDLPTEAELRDLQVGDGVQVIVDDGLVPLWVLVLRVDKRGKIAGSAAQNVGGHAKFGDLILLHTDHVFDIRPASAESLEIAHHFNDRRDLVQGSHWSGKAGSTMQRTKRPSSKHRVHNTHDPMQSARQAKEAIRFAASAFQAAAERIKTMLSMIEIPGRGAEVARTVASRMGEAIRELEPMADRELTRSMAANQGTIQNLLVGQFSLGTAITEVKYARMEGGDVASVSRLAKEVRALEAAYGRILATAQEAMTATGLGRFGNPRARNPEEDVEDLMEMFAGRLSASNASQELREVIRLASMAMDDEATPLSRFMSLTAAERAFGIAVTMYVYDPASVPKDLLIEAVDTMLMAEADTINELFMTEEVDMEVTAADNRVARRVFEEIMRSQRGAQPGPGAPGRGRRRNSSRVSSALGSATGGLAGSMIGGTLGLLGGPSSALVMYVLGGVIGAAAGAALFATIPPDELRTTRLVAALGALATFPLPAVGAAYGTYITRGEQTFARHDREIRALKEGRTSNQECRRLQNRLMK